MMGDTGTAAKRAILPVRGCRKPQNQQFPPHNLSKQLLTRRVNSCALAAILGRLTVEKCPICTIFRQKSA
jgi:hypothetical protein